MTNEQIANEIKDCRQQIRELENKIAELKKGFVGKWKVGDLYEVPDGQAKGRYRVVSAKFGDDGRQWSSDLSVSKYKKDGTLSKVRQYPYGLERAVRIE